MIRSTNYFLHVPPLNLWHFCCIFYFVYFERSSTLMESQFLDLLPERPIVTLNESPRETLLIKIVFMAVLKSVRLVWLVWRDSSRPSILKSKNITLRMIVILSGKGGGGGEEGRKGCAELLFICKRDCKYIRLESLQLMIRYILNQMNEGKT